jgi:phage baseplate assembly protein W
MTSEFLGVGWGFPIAPIARDDQTEDIALVRHEESIQQAIWIILSTAPGERLMRPDFGCGIHDLVFAVSSPGTEAQIASEVRQALLRWEPRIEALEVKVAPAPADPSQLLIDISYRARATNNRFNLVYPFYLDGSAVP